jgi:hypothetical protein
MDEPKRMDRREAIKWMLTAAATVSVLEGNGLAGAVVAKGYGTDPNLMDSYKPGSIWPLTFSPEQRRTVAALCDLIIPADEKSPSASELSVHDFIDEWISAPYSRQQEDRKVVLEGLAWLEAESRKRYEKSFVDATADQKRRITDDICYVSTAAARFKRAAEFFAKFRDLTASGFYTTPEGMKDIQYMGNVALTKFDGPPPEVLAYLKLA